MYPLRITHPEHGATHVYDAAELERHEKLGWKAPVEKPEPKPEPKKRGRPRKS